MSNGFQVIEGGRGAGCGFLSDVEIDAFLAGGLQGDRLEAFDAHRDAGCRPCMLFGADLHTFRDVLDRGVLESERKHFDRVAVRDRVEFAKTLAAATTTRRFPTWILGVAAIFVVVAFLGVQFLGPAGGPIVTLPDGTDYAYAAPAAPSLVRDGGDFARGRAAYVKGDHATAAAAFESVESDDPRHADALFFAGVSRLLEGKSVAAAGLLERSLALSEEQGLPTDETRYYLALVRIEAGQAEDAADLLEAIDPAARPAAAKLLDALR